jgi:hypothetical protein
MLHFFVEVVTEFSVVIGKGEGVKRVDLRTVVEKLYFSGDHAITIYKALDTTTYFWGGVTTGAFFSNTRGSIASTISAFILTPVMILYAVKWWVVVSSEIARVRDHPPKL